MKIREIYERYNIPKHMQRHMLTTAAVVKILSDNWRGPRIDSEVPLTIMLLHDIGNVARMDFSHPEFISEDNKPEEYWRETKERFINKYGPDGHEATAKIMKELGLNDERLFYVFDHKKFIYNEQTAAADDYEIKMCAYSDMISSPSGVVSLDERFEEAKTRAAGNPRAGANHPRAKYFHEAGHEIEKQLFQYSKLDKGKLPEVIEELKNYEVKVPSLSEV